MLRSRVVKIIKPICAIMLAAFACAALAADEPGELLNKDPNLIVDVSSKLINAVVQRSVDRTGPADEVIQDTPVTGAARTIGTVRAALAPDARHGAIDIGFTGNVYSRTIGSRRTIRIQTVTTTSVDVRHRVLFDETGIRIYPGP